MKRYTLIMEGPARRRGKDVDENFHQTVQVVAFDRQAAIKQAMKRMALSYVDQCYISAGKQNFWYSGIILDQFDDIWMSNRLPEREKDR